jgi:hypothetical protein
MDNFKGKEKLVTGPNCGLTPGQTGRLTTLTLNTHITELLDVKFSMRSVSDEMKTGFLFLPGLKIEQIL